MEVFAKPLMPQLSDNMMNCEIDPSVDSRKMKMYPTLGKMDLKHFTLVELVNGVSRK
jgi:hypothetical protein